MKVYTSYKLLLIMIILVIKKILYGLFISIAFKLIIETYHNSNAKIHSTPQIWIVSILFLDYVRHPSMFASKLQEVLLIGLVLSSSVSINFVMKIWIMIF